MKTFLKDRIIFVQTAVQSLYTVHSFSQKMAGKLSVLKKLVIFLLSSYYSSEFLLENLA